MVIWSDIFNMLKNGNSDTAFGVRLAYNLHERYMLEWNVIRTSFRYIIRRLAFYRKISRKEIEDALYYGGMGVGRYMRNPTELLKKSSTAATYVTQQLKQYLSMNSNEASLEDPTLLRKIQKILQGIVYTSHVMSSVQRNRRHDVRRRWR